MVRKIARLTSIFLVANACLVFSGEKSDVGTNHTFALGQEFQLFQPNLVVSKSQLAETALFRFASENELSEKNKGKAFLRSLLIPGWGQHYAESKKMMKTFIISEITLIGVYFGLTTWGNWLEEDYRALAATHAGINLSGKDADYFDNIGRFNSIDVYNQGQLRNRDLSAIYRDTEQFYWSWDNKTNRLEYATIRRNSDLARNRSELTIAVILINHIVSAIHSQLAVFKYNKRLNKEALGLKIEFKNMNQDLAMRLKLSANL